MIIELNGAQIMLTQKQEAQLKNYLLNSVLATPEPVRPTDEHTLSFPRDKEQLLAMTLPNKCYFCEQKMWAKNQYSRHLNHTHNSLGNATEKAHVFTRRHKRYQLGKDCPLCGRTCRGKVGYAVHMSWHKKEADITNVPADSGTTNGSASQSLPY
jgi:hypothetical protein